MYDNDQNYGWKSYDNQSYDNRRYDYEKEIFFL